MIDFLYSFAPLLVPLGVILLGFAIFGERTLWALEVKFPANPAFGEGTVRLKCGSKTGPRVVGFFMQTPACVGKSVEVYLNEQLLMSMSGKRMKGHRLRFKDKVAIDKPKAGELVIIRIGGQVAFSGPLRQS